MPIVSRSYLARFATKRSSCILTIENVPIFNNCLTVLTYREKEIAQKCSFIRQLICLGCRANVNDHMRVINYEIKQFIELFKYSMYYCGEILE